MSHQGKRDSGGGGEDSREKRLPQVCDCFWVMPPPHDPVRNQKLVLNAN